MTNQQHPITPPLELVTQWYNECPEANEASLSYVATAAARWAADNQLLACGNYLKHCAAWEPEDVTEFFNYCRPGPTSLKKQALAVLEEEPEGMKELVVFDTDQVNLIRRALEELPDD